MTPPRPFPFLSATRQLIFEPPGEGDGEGLGDALGLGDGLGDALGLGLGEGCGVAPGFAPEADFKYVMSASRSLAESCEVLPCVSLMT